MPKYIVVFLFAFFLAVLGIPLFIRLSHRLGVLDKPDHRKIHDLATPNLGGLAIFISILIIFALFVGFDGVETNYLVMGCILVLLTGLIDDLFSLGVWKIVGQFIAVVIVIKGGFLFTSMGDLFGFGDIDLGLSASFFTVFACLGVINAINLIDGLDGLAAGIAFLSLVSFMVIGNGNISAHLFLLCACSCGAVLGFLMFNYNPARIFMGDAGSNLLGLLLASFSIIVSQKTTLNSVNPIVSFAFLFIPIIDTLIVMVKRIFTGHWPFAASNDHIHHKLLAVGLSQRKVWTLLIGISAFVDCVVILANKEVPGYVLTYFIFFVVLILFGGVEYHYRKKGKKFICSNSVA